MVFLRADIIGLLTGSANPRKYWSVSKTRLKRIKETEDPEKAFNRTVCHTQQGVYVEIRIFSTLKKTHQT